MRKIVFTALLLVTVVRGFSQQYEIEQLVLDAEKLIQFKQILSDMKEGYEILSKGYNEVRDISQGNFSLHKAFLDGLFTVQPAVRKYFRIAKILTLQKELIRSGKVVYKTLGDSRAMSAEELRHVQAISESVVAKSVEHLGSLLVLLTDGKMRMTEAERLQSIDEIYFKVREQWQFMQQFQTTSGILAIQRLKDFDDVNQVKLLYDRK